MKKQEESKLKELNKAVSVLKSGGVIIFPTDTVYGIGCIWDNAPAIARIRNIKQSKQYFPVLINNIQQAYEIVKVTPIILNLMNKYWPGGLTIIAKNKKTDEKIGIRLPASETVKYLVENVGTPIIGTSANLHGQHTPVSYEELDPRIVNQVDFVLKGECLEGKASTVIDSTILPIKILRKGAVEIK